MSENRLLNSYPSMESYSYSRSHISRYSNYNEVDINFDDDIDNAVNKIMFMLEFDEERIHPYFLKLEDLIRDAFRVNKIDIDSVGRDFYSNNHRRIDGLSLLECVVSLIFDYSGQLKGRCKSILDIAGVRRQYSQGICLQLNASQLNNHLARELKQQLEPFNEEGSLVHIQYTGAEARARLVLGNEYRVLPNDDLMYRLRYQYGERAVELLYES